MPEWEEVLQDDESGEITPPYYSRKRLEVGGKTLSWAIAEGLGSDVAPFPFESLGPRLASIAHAIPEGSHVVDVGCEHAHLLFALLRSGHARSAHGIDKSAASIDEASRRYQHPRLQLTHGQGLEPSSFEPNTTLCIAGVGGHAAAEICQPHSLESVAPEVIVLQVNRDIPRSRAHLAGLHYRIEKEYFVCTAGRMFLTTQFIPAKVLDDAAIFFGDLSAPSVKKHRYLSYEFERLLEKQQLKDEEMRALSVLRQYFSV